MSMRRLLPITVFLLAALHLTWPDPGELSREVNVHSKTTWTSGPVYAESENMNVSMAEELILLHPDGEERYAHLTVIFRFQNSSGEDQNIPVGFPIATRVRATYSEPGYVESTGCPELISLLLGKAIPPEPQDEKKKRETATSLWGTLRDKRRELEWGQFINELQSYTRPEGAPSAIGDFRATQDGEAVQIEKVLIEGPKSSEWSIVTHMLFHLRFPAHSVSTVTVDYKVSPFRDGIDSIRYGCTYILGTGGTWKGPIGKLFCIGRVMNRVLENCYLYRGQSNVLMLAGKDYKPARDESLDFEWGYRSPEDDLAGLSGKRIAEKASERSVYKAVELIGASSFLPGTTTVVECYSDGSIYDSPYSGAPSFRLWSTTYGPAALFDEIRTNAWVEGVKGSGEGEYVEFELKQPAIGIEVYNGLRMLPNPGDDYHLGGEYGDVAATKLNEKNIWMRNNRVKELFLARDGGEPVTLALRDEWGPQVFSGMFLPGRYRVTIKSVYRGKEWDDTALGEIMFLTIPNADLIRKSSPELWKALWGGATP